MEPVFVNEQKPTFTLEEELEEIKRSIELHREVARDAVYA